MRFLTNHPIIFGVVSFVVLWVATWTGGTFVRSRRPLDAAGRADFGVIQAATLTLLGLIIGFSFSMATSRYDQRKAYEEEEANAIGTAYARASLLPEGDTARLRSLLRNYLEQRIVFYETREPERALESDARGARLQAEMWAVVSDAARAEPTSSTALAVISINDVLNRQGYAQAAWWNRIPLQAWALMTAIAVCSCVLVGYGMQNARAESFMLPMLPLVVAIAFLLIADIDSPRSGTISITAQNLDALAQSLRTPPWSGAAP
jgi:hypothetical protein